MFRPVLIFILSLQLALPPLVFAVDPEIELSKLSSEEIDEVLGNFLESGESEDPDLLQYFLNERLSRSDTEPDPELLRGVFRKLFKSNTQGPDSIIVSYILSGDKDSLQQNAQYWREQRDQASYKNGEAWRSAHFYYLLSSIGVLFIEEVDVLKKLVDKEDVDAFHQIPTLVDEFVRVRDEIVPQDEKAKEELLVLGRSGEVLERVREPLAVAIINFYPLLSKEIYGLLKQVQLLLALLSLQQKKQFSLEELEKFSSLSETRFGYLSDIQQFSDQRIHLVYSQRGDFERLQTERNSELLRLRADATLLCLRDGRESLNAAAQIASPPACAEVNWPERYVDPKSTYFNDRVSAHLKTQERLAFQIEEFHYWRAYSELAIDPSTHLLEGAIKNQLLPTSYTISEAEESINILTEQILQTYSKAGQLSDSERDNFDKFIRTRFLHELEKGDIQSAINLGERFLDQEIASPLDLLFETLNAIQQPKWILHDQTQDQLLWDFLETNKVSRALLENKIKESEKVREEEIQKLPRYLGMEFDALPVDQVAMADQSNQWELVKFWEDNKRLRLYQATLFYFYDGGFAQLYSSHPSGYQSDVFRIDSRWYALCQKLHPSGDRAWSNPDSTQMGFGFGDYDSTRPMKIRPGWSYHHWLQWEREQDEKLQKTWEQSQKDYHFYSFLLKVDAFLAAAVVTGLTLGKGAPLGAWIIAKAGTTGLMATELFVVPGALYGVDKFMDAFAHPDGSFRGSVFESETTGGKAKEILEGYLTFVAMAGVCRLTGVAYKGLFRSEIKTLFQKALFGTGAVGAEVLTLTAFGLAHRMAYSVYAAQVLHKKEQIITFDEISSSLRFNLLFVMALKVHQIIGGAFPNKLQNRLPKDPSNSLLNRASEFWNRFKIPTQKPLKPLPRWTILGFISDSENIQREAKTKLLDWLERAKRALTPPPPLLPAFLPNEGSGVPRSGDGRLGPRILRIEGGKEEGGGAEPVPSTDGNAKPLPPEPAAIDSLGPPVEKTQAGEKPVKSERTVEGLDPGEFELPVDLWAMVQPARPPSFLTKLRHWWGKQGVDGDPLQKLLEEVEIAKRGNSNEGVPANTHRSEVHFNRLLEMLAEEALKIRSRQNLEEGWRPIQINVLEGRGILQDIKDLLLGREQSDGKSGKPSLAKLGNDAKDAEETLQALQEKNPELLSQARAFNNPGYSHWNLEAPSKAAKKSPPQVRASALSRAEGSSEKAQSAIRAIRTFRTARSQFHQALYRYYRYYEPYLKKLETSFSNEIELADAKKTFSTKEIKALEEALQFRDLLDQTLDGSPQTLARGKNVVQLQALRDGEFYYAEVDSRWILRNVGGPFYRLAKLLIMRKAAPILQSPTAQALSDTMGNLNDNPISNRVRDKIGASASGDQLVELQKIFDLSGKERTKQLNQWLEKVLTAGTAEIDSLIRIFSAPKIIGIVQRAVERIGQHLPLQKAEGTLLTDSKDPKGQVRDIRELGEILERIREHLEKGDDAQQRAAHYLQQFGFSNQNIVTIENVGEVRTNIRKAIVAAAVIAATITYFTWGNPTEDELKELQEAFQQQQEMKKTLDELVKMFREFLNGKPVSPQQVDKLVVGLESYRTQIENVPNPPKITIQQLGSLIDSVKMLKVQGKPSESLIQDIRLKIQTIPGLQTVNMNPDPGHSESIDIQPTTQPAATQPSLPSADGGK